MHPSILKIVSIVTLLTSCQNTPLSNAISPENNDFQIQALNQTYLSRKINRWLSTSNGPRLLRELQYAQAKHPALLQQLISQSITPTPTTLYNQLTAVTEVSSYSGSNSGFGSFIQSLNPNPNQISCKAYYNRNNNFLNDRVSGVKTLDPDGTGPTPSYQAYCDQEHDGGGWTMVVAQFEADPVTNWAEGLQNDYDPTLVSGRGFALGSTQLPADRTHTAFGKHTDATFVDYVPYIYNTGNLALSTSLLSPKTGFSYYLHRNTNQHYGYHNVAEDPIGTSPLWDNTLSIDRIGARYWTWAFSPTATQVARGHSMAGETGGTGQSYAWTVWVR